MELVLAPGYTVSEYIVKDLSCVHVGLVVVGVFFVVFFVFFNTLF